MAGFHQPPGARTTPTGRSSWTWALAGLLIVVPSLRALPDALDLLDQGSFGRTFGIFITVLLLLIISFGATCFYLAVKLIQADRAGRVLTIMLAASLAFGLLLADGMGTSEILAILGCGGVIAILWLVEEVTDFFTGPHAAQAEVATSVVAARSLVVALSWVLGATGIAFLPLGDLQGRFVVVGLIMMAVAGVAFKYSADLIPGDESARQIVTGLMVVYVIAILVTEPNGAGLFIPIGLAASVIALLWGPEDARQHFEKRSPTI